MRHPDQVKRLYSLDFLRGLASMAVIFWHWQHFYMPGYTPLDDRSMLPYYPFLYPLYDYGWIAVDIFFCISGFVFFWLYSDRIEARGLSLRTFSILRISRLYPLHVVTLIYMAIAQYLVRAATGASFVTPYNDAFHFVLNLVFAQSWGFQGGESFNGPAWSISVEVMLYALFFGLAFTRLSKRTVILLLLMAAGIVIMLVDRQIGRGFIGFFAGGIMYHVWKSRAASIGGRTSSVLLGVCMLSWIVDIVLMKHDVIRPVLKELGAMGIPGMGPLVGKLDTLLLLFVRTVQIPATVLVLALHEVRSGTRFYEKPARLGDLTYASYMIHFPLQISIFYAVVAFDLPGNLLEARWLLPAFFSILIVLSIMVYIWFELPMQSWMRARLSAGQGR